jgi:GxxExxY protein
MDAAGLVHRELSERVIGAFYDTYNELGHGFLESVYENAFAIQLEQCGLQVTRQQPVVVRYRGHVVGEFRADLMVADLLLIEIKTVSSLMPIHEAQLMNYLKATGIRLGLLVNFGPRPQFRRRIR